MSVDNRRPTLTAPQQALSVYLESLLRPSPPVSDQLPDTRDDLSRHEKTAGHVPKIITPIAPDEAPRQLADVAETHPQPTESFQVLFLKVGKLTLAVPLVKLNGILKREDIHITPIPGHAPWHLGLIRDHEFTTSLIDTARLILPPDRQGSLATEGEYQYFILIDDKCWALGCHSLANIVTLTPEEVKWRHCRTTRPWLAGTVIEKTCAILDIDGLVQTLNNHKKP